MKHYQVQPIALNASMCDSMNKILQTDNTKILNNGVDLSEYSRQCDRDKKRMDLNIPQNAFWLFMLEDLILSRIMNFL